jgi:hypothetical protein
MFEMTYHDWSRPVVLLLASIVYRVDVVGCYISYRKFQARRI